MSERERERAKLYQTCTGGTHERIYGTYGGGGWVS